VRRPRPLTVSLELSAAEAAAFDQLKAAAFLGADLDVLRLALWRLAAHYDLRLPPGIFTIGAPPARPAARRRRKATGAA
jgi:hypothetical protein